MKDVPDPRCKRQKPHDIAEILTYLVMGFLAGRLSLRRILNWAEKDRAFLQQHMPLKNGIASVATVSRLLSSIDMEAFLYVFVEWVAELLDTRGIHVAIDGKALRGAAEKARGGKTPYILNVIDAATQLVVAQYPIGEKKNEAAEIPKLLELLAIEGSTVTIDAIGTCQGVMEALLKKGAHFFLPVKENLPLTYEQECSFFRTIKEEREKQKDIPGYQSPYKEELSEENYYSSFEKNRGRMEYRDMYTSRNVSVIDYIQIIPEISTIGLSEQIRIPIVRDQDGNDITPDKAVVLGQAGGEAGELQIVGFLTDLEIGAKEASQLKRDHWRIENSLHHVLDDLFREDRSTATKSRDNLALIRKFAYNILRIAIKCEYPENGMTEMMDKISDDLEMMAGYIFGSLKSFY